MASCRIPIVSVAVTAFLLTGGRPTSGNPDRAPALVVSAAASLATALTEIARLYDKGQADGIALGFGATGVLGRQIMEGAAVDLFVSDDEATMRSLDAAGKLEPGTRVSLLSNQLVIVVPAGRAKPLTSGAELKAATFRRIAIGDPSVEPAGVYARRYLEVVGIWRDLGPRVVTMATTREALSAAETGKVDAAILFRTDARSSKKVAIALAIPRDRTPGIVYQAAVMKNGRNKEAARALLNYLRDRDARAVFQREGFVTLVAGQLRPPAVN